MGEKQKQMEGQSRREVGEKEEERSGWREKEKERKLRNVLSMSACQDGGIDEECGRSMAHNVTPDIAETEINKLSVSLQKNLKAP